MPLAMAFVTFSGVAIAQQAAPIFSLPLDCQARITCFIQNYVDIDPSKAVRDYASGQATYDGHKGVDFRLLSTSSITNSINVIASAPGVIKAARDGMVDRLIKDMNDKSILNRECGNGVVIDHGNGWETQYCHLRQNSVIAKKGQIVKRNEPLGKVGYSGQAQFAHVHISVRHNGKVVDPFSGIKIIDANNIEQFSNGLWENSVTKAFSYRSGILLQSGFSSVIVSPDDLENGKIVPAPSSTQSPAIIFYARFINLKKGDKIGFNITSPQGELVKTISDPLERNKATYVAYSGKKRPNSGWQQGDYQGQVQLIRDGEIIVTQNQKIEIK